MRVTFQHLDNEDHPRNGIVLNQSGAILELLCPLNEPHLRAAPWLWHALGP